MKKVKGDNNKPEKNAIKRFVKSLDLPNALTGGSSSIEIIGTESVSVEGVKGILEYDENIIKLSVGRYYIKVTGCSLEMNNYLENAVVISGEIYAVAFEK